MRRCAITAACFALAAVTVAGAQSIAVYQTTPDLLEALQQLRTLHFSSNSDPGQTAPLITVDDNQRFQEMDGFGASLTDWLRGCSPGSLRRRRPMRPSRRSSAARTESP